MHEAWVPGQHCYVHSSVISSIRLCVSEQVLDDSVFFGVFIHRHHLVAKEQQ